MKSLKIIALVFLGLAANAYAGPFTDDMSKCLVKNTTQEDKEALIKWIYAAMSNHPSVKSLSNVSVKQGEELNKRAAELMVELLTQRCKVETQQAIKFEGETAIRTSFQILGQVAMQDLMANQAVAKYISGIASHVDKNAIEEALGKKPSGETEATKPSGESKGTEAKPAVEDKKPEAAVPQ